MCLSEHSEKNIYFWYRQVVSFLEHFSCKAKKNSTVLSNVQCMCPREHFEWKFLLFPKKMVRLNILRHWAKSFWHLVGMFLSGLAKLFFVCIQSSWQKTLLPKNNVNCEFYHSCVFWGKSDTLFVGVVNSALYLFIWTIWRKTNFFVKKIFREFFRTLSEELSTMYRSFFGGNLKTPISLCIRMFLVKRFFFWEKNFFSSVVGFFSF